MALLSLILTLLLTGSPLSISVYPNFVPHRGNVVINLIVEHSPDNKYLLLELDCENYYRSMELDPNVYAHRLMFGPLPEGGCVAVATLVKGEKTIRVESSEISVQ